MEILRIVEKLEAYARTASSAVVDDAFSETMSEAAQLLVKQGERIADLEEQNRWIPVTERLPDLHTDDYEEPDGSRMQFEVSDNHWVVTASGDQVKARYETGVVFQGWVGDFGETIRNVTHWMPLPERPEVLHG